MNILIYFGNQLNPFKGGTERVACAIAQFLAEKGNKILYLAARKINDPNSVKSYFLPESHQLPSKSNVMFLSNLISGEKIDVIINEGASTESIYLFSHKYIDKNIKIINHLHFGVTGDLKYFLKTQKLQIFGVKPKESIINFLKFLKTPYNKYRALANKKVRYKYMVEESDFTVVLSPKQREALIKMTGTENSAKIISIINPIPEKCLAELNKENIVIYVGRLDYPQKRVDRVLEVWRRVFLKLPAWKLIIVGYGPEEENLKKHIQKNNIKNVVFTGFTDSQPYYTKAKILLLTSNFEGTPMVIPEAMSNGVVPIVMDTFDDTDLFIDDGVNGFITKSFSTKEMAGTVLTLSENNGLLEKMSQNAIDRISSISNTDLMAPWLSAINHKQIFN